MARTKTEQWVNEDAMGWDTRGYGYDVNMFETVSFGEQLDRYRAITTDL